MSARDEITRVVRAALKEDIEGFGSCDFAADLADRLIAHLLTDEVVERAAEVIRIVGGLGHFDPYWLALRDDLKAPYRDQARAALQAALGVES